MEATSRFETKRSSGVTTAVSVKVCLATLMVAVGLFFDLGIARLREASAEEGRPRLQIESAVYNFGTARQGDKVTTTFKLKNAGTAELLIQRVVAACGCTSTTPGKEKLAPGESTDIKVTFDTTGFTGEKLKTVRVFSNDPDQPAAVLTIQGVVEPDVSVEPARLIFPEIVRGEAAQGASQEFSIKVRPGAAVRLGAPASTSSSITVSELPGGSETAKRIQVTLSPDLPPGEFRERVVVPLIKGSSSALNVPVVATVKGTVELRPVALSFGVLEGKTPVQKTARLDNLGSSPIAIESVSSDNQAVAVTSRPVRGDGRQHEIVVTVDPEKIASDLRATITIKTSRKSEPALVLGVYGIRPIN